MIYHKTENNCVVVIKRGESIVASLKDFCQKEGIVSGFFYGLGAVDQVELAHYSVEDKKYSSYKFEEPLEMVSLIGNVFLGPGKELIVHSHASFSRPNGEMVGGHLVEARISGTCEIHFSQFSLSLQKQYDEETGLKIL
jgi:predicted DNA-binding protein with PD1-like motif